MLCSYIADTLVTQNMPAPADRTARRANSYSALRAIARGADAADAAPASGRYGRNQPMCPPPGREAAIPSSLHPDWHDRITVIAARPQRSPSAQSDDGLRSRARHWIRPGPLGDAYRDRHARIDRRCHRKLVACVPPTIAAQRLRESPVLVAVRAGSPESQWAMPDRLTDR